MQNMFMQKYSRAMWIIAALSLLMLAACSQEATEVSFEEVCDPGNDHQKISTVGYFAARASIFCSDIGGDYRCGMDFLDAPGSENRFTADVLEGSGRNQLAPIPESYSDADLQLRTADGSLIGLEQKVRVSGEMLIGEGVCLMTVDTIEAVTE
jgi:hypothetical protein